MKDITATLLASLFVLITLISLLSAERAPDAARTDLVDNQEKISDLGLRFALKR